MRFRIASHARTLALSGLAVLLAACSTTVTQEPIATASIAPRPPEGMLRNAPPAYIETGSLGNASTAPMPQQPRYRWSEAPRPTGPVQPAPPVANPQPMRWHAAPRSYHDQKPATAMSNGSQVIVVREGDTLYGISRHYRVPLSDLIAANRLDHGKIEVGQKLIVPAGGRTFVQARN